MNQEGERVRLDEVELSGKSVFSDNGHRLVIKEHPELAGLFEVQDLLSAHMKQLDRKIFRSATISKMSNDCVYSEIGDIDRFDKSEQVVSYLGVNPMIERSGDTVKHSGISHGGPNWLRGVLTQAAWAHVKHAPYS